MIAVYITVLALFICPRARAAACPLGRAPWAWSTSPGRARSTDQPVPRVGGIAIAAGALVAMLVWLPWRPEYHRLPGRRAADRAVRGGRRPPRSAITASSSPHSSLARCCSCGIGDDPAHARTVLLRCGDAGLARAAADAGGAGRVSPTRSTCRTAWTGWPAAPA